MNGKLGGVAAREIFSKSGLDNDELIQVWNLADVDKDGALDEREFTIAMHLVDTRRLKQIPLPPALPPQLLNSLGMGGGQGGGMALSTSLLLFDLAHCRCCCLRLTFSSVRLTAWPAIGPEWWRWRLLRSTQSCTNARSAGSCTSLFIVTSH